MKNKNNEINEIKEINKNDLKKLTDALISAKTQIQELKDTLEHKSIDFEKLKIDFENLKALNHTKDTELISVKKNCNDLSLILTNYEKVFDTLKTLLRLSLSQIRISEQKDLFYLLTNYEV